MTSLRLLIALPLLPLGMNAQTAAATPLPDRPAAALSKYKDNWVPVVGAEGATPVAMAGTGQVTLETNAGIALSVGDHYAGGFVTVTDAQSTDVPAVNDAEQAATETSFKSTAETFEATLVADSDIPGVYAVMIGSPPDQKPDAAPSLAVKVWQIGDLKAGKVKHIAVKLPKLRYDGGPEWSLLLFTGGRQIRSTGMGEILPQYFDRIESLSLKRRIAERVEKGVDAPIAAFRQMPLGLPDALKEKYKGTTVKVQLTVNAEGHVVSAVPVGLADPELSDALGKGFGPWLFLPPEKGGVATSSSAIIPLKM